MAKEGAAVARKASLIQKSLSGLTYLRVLCSRLLLSRLGNIQASLASPFSFAPRQYSSKLGFTFLLRASEIFKQAWLHLPPSRLGNIQASLILLSAWRR
ncbi:MAG: hypothetical protein MR984_02595 [Bacteroidales bacterium]|nr:hypothetical protein [Bacteroidales bacterium]